ADTPTRTPAARRTTGNPGAGTPPRGQPPHTHRPIAGTAIRWPRATHRLGSLLATVAKRGEEGSLTSERDGKILARQRQADSNIAKEHSREPGQDAQRIRPSTPGLRRSWPRPATRSVMTHHHRWPSTPGCPRQITPRAPSTARLTFPAVARPAPDRMAGGMADAGTPAWSRAAKIPWLPPPASRTPPDQRSYRFIAAP